MKKLNVGCGLDYREGYVNLDNNHFDKRVKVDVDHDLTKFPYSFKDNTFDEILLQDVIEHIREEYTIKFLEEPYRIAKPNAIIKIWTGHFSGRYAFNHITHYIQWGIDSFGTFEPTELFDGERYSHAVFKVEKRRLHFFHPRLIRFKFLSKLPIDWMFNFGYVWQQIMERFQFLGFDEVSYELRVIK